MKTILFILLLTVTASLYGQKYEPITPKFKQDTAARFFIRSSGSAFENRISFHNNATQQAFVRNGSDTLVITDSVLTLYDIRIRYIKIKDKVYPLQ